MNVAEKIGNVTGDLKSKAQQARSERLDDSNEELKRENKLLREQLDDDSADRGRMLAILERMEMTPRKRKRGGWTRTVVMVGVAYVLGARAGRERYEQIRQSWGRMVNRTPTAEVMGRVQDMGQTAKDQIGSVAQTVKEQVGRAQGHADDTAKS